MDATRPRPYSALFEGLDLPQTRARILQGVALAVSARGVAATTVQHILEAGEVSRRTFYQHYKNKQDALDALFEVSTGMLLRHVRLAVAGTSDPLLRISQALDAYLGIQCSGGALVIALQAEAVRPDSALAPRREQTLDRLVELFSLGMEASLGRPLDVLVYRSLFLSVDGLVLHLQAKGNFNHEDSARVRRVCLPIMLRTLVPHRQGLPELPGPPA